MTSPDLPAGFLEAVDSAPFGFCLLNASNHEISYVNYAFGPMLGQFDIININQNIEELIPDYIMQYIFHQAQRSYDYDCEIFTETGSSRWVRIHVEEINYKSQPYLALWINDVTQIIESESRNAQALKAMEQAAEMKSNLLATMSHEIRTPMQAVFGFLELIAEEKPDQKILDMVTTARSSAADLLEILDDVLDLAKLDADKMELDNFEIPVRTLSSGVIEALEVKKFGNNVDLLSRVGEDVPSVVKGDPKRLRQILINAGAASPDLIIEQVRTEKKASHGFNAQTMEHADLVKAGVVDPTKVVCHALQNAASVSGLLLTTEALVSELPEDDGPQAPGGGDF